MKIGLSELTVEPFPRISPTPIEPFVCEESGLKEEEKNYNNPVVTPAKVKMFENRVCSS